MSQPQELQQVLEKFKGKKYICIYQKQCLDEFYFELDRELRKTAECKLEDIETVYGYLIIKCGDRRIYVEFDHYITVVLKIGGLTIRNL